MVPSPASLARMVSSIVFLVLAVSPLPSTRDALAAWPPDGPIPRIETNMHTAPIWRLSMDAQERFLVTGSKDKTARVWDLAGGELKLLKILRVPLGEHPYEGQIFSVAISPGGEKVAVAGYTGKKVPSGRKGTFNIHIFDRASGNLAHTIAGLPIDISHLTFSRDGQYLAVSLMGSWGIKVYRSRDWQEIYADPNYGHRNDCFWIEFGPENLLVTTAWKDGLRLYRPSGGGFERIGAPKKIMGGKKPIAARFSPDGTLLAVGFKDVPPRVMVFDVRSLLGAERPEPLFLADTRGLTGDGHLARVAWSRNGDTLYAGGGFSEGGIHSILSWSEKGRGPATRMPAATDSVMDLWPLKDGRLVFGAQDPAIGILDAEGRRLRVNVPDMPIFYHKEKQLRLSGDGSMVEFAFDMQDIDLTRKTQQARLDIKTRTFSVNPSADPRGQELSPLDTTGFKDTDWQDTRKPRFRNRVLSLGGEEVSYCLTRIPGGRGFILGTNWHLRFFDERGAPRGRPIELPGSAYVVNVSGDGRVAVVALGDGTLRWYSLENNKEILAFFLHRDGRWVMWSPEGFFTCSPDGGKLIGYHLNQGLDQTPQFVTSDQLFDQFYRRDLVAWKLVDPPQNEVKTALSKGSVNHVLAGGLPPAVEIIGPPEVHNKGEEFTLHLKIMDKGGGIGKIVYQVNGITLEPRKSRDVDPFSTPGYQGATLEVPEKQQVALENPGKQETPLETAEKRETTQQTKGWQEASVRGVETKWPLILEKGKKNIITVVVKNSNGVESMPAILTVYCDEPKTKDLPTLYGLVAGISSYSNIKLEYAAKDAIDLKAEIEKRGQGLFKEIKIRKLVDQEVTLKGIDDAFQELAPQVKPDDAFLLFLAGHGKNLQGCYYFLPYGLRATDDESLRLGGLDQEKLQALLAKIPARKSVILLDTCYSGTFALLPPPVSQKNALDHVNRQLGRRAILSSASDQQVALEGYEGHGLFTYALLEGLKRPNADLNGDGKIDIQELFTTVKAKVTRIARERWRIKQEPMSSDLRFVDFEIARVN